VVLGILLELEQLIVLIGTTLIFFVMSVLIKPMDPFPQVKLTTLQSQASADA